jgi:hypothetical protein
MMASNVVIVLQNRFALLSVSIEVRLDQRDFATSVLYMRAKDGIILSGL